MARPDETGLRFALLPVSTLFVHFHDSNDQERIHEWQDRRTQRAAKEAAGAMADDDKLRREGKIDQTAGKTRQAIDKVVYKTKEALQGKPKE